MESPPCQKTLHASSPAGGTYQNLLSYKKSEIIYDLTFRFCERFLNCGDRTIDQLVQAARSGKENIAEGSKASVTSTEMKLKLTNVARASLEELLLDDQDFVRVRDHLPWEKYSKEALYVRKLGRTENESYETYESYRTYSASSSKGEPSPNIRSSRKFQISSAISPTAHNP